MKANLKSTTSRRLPLVLLCFFLLHVSCCLSRVQGAGFTYQGRLIFGTNVANGSYDFQFALSNAVSGGTQIGSTVTSLAVFVTNGLFLATPDFGNVLNGQSAWLAVSVRSNNTGNYVGMTPLQPITPAPYAIFASSASNVLGTIPGGGLGGTYANTVFMQNPGNTFDGNGSGLTSLNPANLLGPVPDATLTTNVALLNRSPQNFSGNTNTFAGNVGIGTNNPFYRLSVVGTGVTDDGRLLLQTTAGTYGPQLRLNKGGPGGEEWDFIADGTNNGPPGALQVIQASAAAVRFMIATNGSVGIGTTNPATTLHVNGGVTATNFYGSFTGNAAGLTNFGPQAFTTLSVSNLSVTATNQIAPLTAIPRVPAAATGTVATGNEPFGMAIVGNYAYVLNQSDNTIEVIDVSTPSAPVVIATLGTDTGPYAIAVAGNYAYVANQSGTLQVIDLSYPSAPSAIGRVSITGGNTLAVAVAGNYAYVVNYTGNSLQVIDVSNPSLPVKLASTSTGSGSEPVDIAVAGRFAYVVNYGSAVLEIFDLSFPSVPVIVGTIGTDTTPSSVAVAGRYAYVANKNANTLQVFDVSNPAAPGMTGRFGKLNFAPESIAVAGRYAYVASGYNYLQVFDVSNPASLVALGTVGTANSPYSITPIGRYVYVVNATSGNLQVFDFGGAYVQQFEAGTAEVGTLQALDTVTVGNALNVRNSLNVGGNALVSGALSVSGPLHVGIGSAIYNLEAGQAIMPPSNTQETNFTIVFPTAFSSPPKISFSLANDPTYQAVSDVFVSNVSSNSFAAFTINVYRANGVLWAQQLRVNWQAWQ